jgi:hypothetical protein
MRLPAIPTILLLLLGASSVAAQSTEPPAVDARPEPVATMSELMVHMIYPASDAIFYITTREPSTSEEWAEIQMKALVVAESANLLLLPENVRPGSWMRDALLMRDAGRAAFEAAKARDLEALAEVNDPLYRSCVACHRSYRPDYGRPPR